MAAAGYYQGLPSVQQNGLFTDTQQYVDSVIALRAQFGGGGERDVRRRPGARSLCRLPSHVLRRRR